MAEPKRKLSISVPSLPWLERDDDSTHFPNPKQELETWEAARRQAMISAQLRQAEQEEQRNEKSAP